LNACSQGISPEGSAERKPRCHGRDAVPQLWDLGTWRNGKLPFKVMHCPSSLAQNPHGGVRSCVSAVIFHQTPGPHTIYHLCVHSEDRTGGSRAWNTSCRRRLGLKNSISLSIALTERLGMQKGLAGDGIKFTGSTNYIP
jgi:hypothetical protein